MTAPDAPQVEPLTYTLEEALVQLGERGCTLAAYGRDGAPREFVLRDAYSPHVRGFFSHWKDAVEEVLGVPVVPRDDTAELVAALEAWLAWATARTRRTSTSVAFPNLHLPIGDLVATSRAALARVKGGESSDEEARS